MKKYEKIFTVLLFLFKFFSFKGCVKNSPTWNIFGIIHSRIFLGWNRYVSICYRQTDPKMQGCPYVRMSVCPSVGPSVSNVMLFLFGLLQQFKAVCPPLFISQSFNIQSFVSQSLLPLISTHLIHSANATATSSLSLTLFMFTIKGGSIFFREVCDTFIANIYISISYLFR